MTTLTEKIAEACFPMFERVWSVAQEPVSHQGRFRLVECGVYEIGPKFADGGICLDASHLPLDDVTLGAGFYIFGLDELTPPTFRVQVGWFRSWSHDRQAGFSLLEYCSGCCPASVDDGRRWVERILPRFERSLREALKRGGPPSRMVHFWQRFWRQVPPPFITIHPHGALRAYPDMSTFAERYDIG
ncbi:hypothetical protein SAMN02745166_02024 [Prosthecobacter debontii]|uniref:Uncharacterized protein n=1 Tax=Prosthecobacter debontii TaxID=48467 RepID=A0A1T4XV21_9BACT|nr:hypothetical protein SAMN02745166_02024 [Prosthecobacter debontii]